MSPFLLVRLQPELKEVVTALLGRTYLLQVGGRGRLAQFGQERGNPVQVSAKRDPNASLVMVIEFTSVEAAERFIRDNAGLLAKAVGAPTFFERLRQPYSNVLPPTLA